MDLPAALTDLQEQVIVGNLLGDGTLSRPETDDSNSSFVFSQKKQNELYVRVVADVMQPYTSGVSHGKGRKPIRINGKVTSSREYWDGTYVYYVRMRTHRHPVFTELRYKWYAGSEGKWQKQLPVGVKLTWLTLAYWAMDDGTNDFHGRKFRLLPYDFSFPDVARMIELLVRVS